MRQIGYVMMENGNTATVSVRRMSACEGCHKANPGMADDNGVRYAACHECSMFPQDTELSVTAENQVGAKAGDTVIIESSSQMILGYAVCVFLMPIFMAAVLGVLAALLFPYQMSAYLGAVIGFLGAFWIVRRFVDRHAKEKTVYTIISITANNGRISTADAKRV